MFLQQQLEVLCMHLAQIPPVQLAPHLLIPPAQSASQGVLGLHDRTLVVNERLQQIRKGRFGRE